jgi:sugar phosphate isomerase/epimerase
MIIAARTHDYGKQAIDKLPSLLKNEGIGAAQLVLPKAFTSVDSYADIDTTVLEQIKTSFDQAGIRIHILGCYMDLANTDATVRKQAVATFKTCLSYAKLLGAAIVGTETAYPRLSAVDKQLWKPYMMESLAELVAEAERVGQDMAIEPVYWHPLQDLETTAAVFEHFQSKRLRMIFDPANVLEFPNIDQPKYWQAWLHTMGTKIDAVHMKDFRLGASGEYIPTLLGEGVIDYSEIVSWFGKNKPDIVVVREELQPAHAAKDLAYMRQVWG